MAVSARSSNRAISRSFFWIALGAVVLGGISYYDDLSTLNIRERPEADEVAGVQATSKKQANPQPLDFSHVAEEVNDSIPIAPQLKPVIEFTGILRKPVGHAVAPLLIKTSPGYDYYVKLVARTDDVVMTMYIKGGERFQTLVPLGTFELRYAAGTTWYGEDDRFGKDTAYSKAGKLFNFDFDGLQYSGYTVELIMQTNGNLPVSAISKDEF